MRKYTVTLLLIISYFTLSYAGGPDTLWTKIYGGGGDDLGYSVVEVADGYSIAGCYSAGSGQLTEFWLLKTDFSGNMIWQKTYGSYHTDRAHDHQQTDDGGYIIAGWSLSFGTGDFDYYVIKTDSLGNEIWAKVYGSFKDDMAYSVQQTSDGGYIIAGDSWTYGSVDFWLVKTDANGDTIWTKAIGGSEDDKARSIQQTLDGGYIIAGHTGRSGRYDVYIVKTDANGDTIWTRRYGGPSLDWGNSVQQTTDGGYIVAGWQYTDLYADFYIIKMDEFGDTIWTKLYGTSNCDYANCIEQTSDGGYITVGQTGSDIWLMKLDANGDTLWSQVLGWMWDDVAYDVIETSDKGYIITGYADGVGAGWFDLFIIKTEPDIRVEEEITPSLKNFYGSTIISGPLRLPQGKDCRVLDISGRQIEPDRLQPGIYFIEVDNKITQKVVKIR